MNDFKKKYGIIIGVSDYDPNEDFKKLQFAKNDAFEVYQTLLVHCGFKKEQLHLLANGLDEKSELKPIRPTRANIMSEVDHAAKNAGENDLIYLYFAGHGVEISSCPYLITEDTKMNVLSMTAIDVNELNSMLEKSSARCIVRVFDACRSAFSVARGQFGMMTDVLERAFFESVKGWASFSSCSSDEVSYESGDFSQGVFSYYLCEGLKGNAANDQGLVTLDSLVDYVKISVANWCDAQSKTQTPHLQSDLSGVLTLAKAVNSPKPAQIPPTNPFADLASGLNRHVSAAPSDSKNLTFTNDEELSRFAELTHGLIDRFTREINSNWVEVSVSDSQPLQNIDSVSFNLLEQRMKSLNVSTEFENKTVAQQVVFKSSQVIIPTTVLTVVAVRFSFFYWLWYCHRCQLQQLQGRFKPEPSKHIGFFNFKPQSSVVETKVETAVREMLNRTNAEMLKWANQLGELVEERLAPLREIEKMIE